MRGLRTCSACTLTLGTKRGTGSGEKRTPQKCHTHTNLSCAFCDMSQVRTPVYCDFLVVVFPWQVMQHEATRHNKIRRSATSEMPSKPASSFLLAVVCISSASIRPHPTEASNHLANLPHQKQLFKNRLVKRLPKTRKP